MGQDKFAKLWVFFEEIVGDMSQRNGRCLAQIETTIDDILCQATEAKKLHFNVRMSPQELQNNTRLCINLFLISLSMEWDEKSLTCR